MASDGVNADGSEFWWIGALSSAKVPVPNSGVQAVLEEVDSPPTGPGCFDCWASEYLDNDRWGQVGFSTCTVPGSAPFHFDLLPSLGHQYPAGNALGRAESEVVAPGCIPMR